MFKGLPKIRLETGVAWAFIAPNIISLLVFMLYPIVYGLKISLNEWDLLTSPKWVGLGNYFELFFEDPLFLIALRNTLYYSILIIPGGVIISLVLALLLLNENLRGIILCRTIFFVPYVSATVVVAIIWQLIYSSEFGILNHVLVLFHLPPQKWLQDPMLAIPSIAVMSIWKTMGYNMVLFIAGLKAIPPRYYEAARIDGANWWQQFWQITIPLLMPTIFFIGIISTIGSFQVFDAVYVMTEGGPGNATLVVNYYLYQNAFTYLRMGKASAIAFVLFGLIIGASLLQVKFFSKKVTYGVT